MRLRYFRDTFHYFKRYGDTRPSEDFFWEYLPYLFKGYGILSKIFKGIWDTGTPPPPSRASDL